MPLLCTHDTPNHTIRRRHLFDFAQLPGRASPAARAERRALEKFVTLQVQQISATSDQVLLTSHHR